MEPYECVARYTEVLATLRTCRVDIATGVLVVGEFGEKATIPRRLHLLNNDHVCQPPPSAL